MINSFDKELRDALVQRQSENLYRHRKSCETAQGVRVVLDGKQYLNFCSNDYLGLANHPDLIAAAKSALEHYGAGSGASHLVCGHSREHHAFEEEMAEFLGRDRSLLFSSGYMANLGVAQALLNHKSSLIEDKLNHASLIDAASISGAKLKRYTHNDCQALKSRLESAQGRTLVAVDGVFSMDGDIAPLVDISDLCTQANAVMWVDDAHGLGVMGPNGEGSVAAAGLNQEQVPVLMSTLGKGLGSFGAVVSGSEALIESLIQFSRTYIYTTALPPAVAATSRAGLRLIKTESWRREKLQTLISQFRRGAADLGYTLMPSGTPIQPILMGQAQSALNLSQALADAGIWVTAIRPPTVPHGEARLRITISAAHSEADISFLLNVLERNRGLLK